MITVMSRPLARDIRFNGLLNLTAAPATILNPRATLPILTWGGGRGEKWACGSRSKSPSIHLPEKSAGRKNWWLENISGVSG